MITIELDEKTIRQVLADYINEKLGSLRVDPTSVKLLVKSKQNYRSEWEEAGAVYTNKTAAYIPELKVEAKG